MFLIFF